MHKQTLKNKCNSSQEKPHGVARVISKRGFCSRSQAENLVREGRVSLRGKIVRDPDTPALENDKILVDGKAVTASNFVYFTSPTFILWAMYGILYQTTENIKPSCSQ